MVMALELESLGLVIGVDCCATRRGGPVFSAEEQMVCGNVVVCCGRGVGGMRFVAAEALVVCGVL